MNQEKIPTTYTAGIDAKREDHAIVPAAFMAGEAIIVMPREHIELIKTTNDSYIFMVKR